MWRVGEGEVATSISFTLPAVTKGQTLGGRFHPVVFDTTRIDMSALPVAGV